ncbi:MAG: gliding motility-associated C-terminal domain-containing protein [Putridiphycobacter sp.]|nr:gliding motility-associated C-terminal domain-containing protein [Putridiphycobacter sp.]
MMTRVFLLIFSCLIISVAFAQPLNDNCGDAQELCAGNIVEGNTAGATLEQCFTTNVNGCADDNGGNGFCFVPSATICYMFTTNSNGGNVTVNFTNLNINPDPAMGQKLHAVMLRSENPCEGGNYSYFSQCNNNGVAAFSLTSTTALAPNTTYYIQVNGSGVGPGVTQPAQITFDIMVSGPGVDVLPMQVDISAANLDICQYDQVPIDITFTNCSGNPKFEWYFNGELVGDLADFQTRTLTESGFLYLRATCGTEACPNIDASDSLFFNVSPVEADAGPDILIEVGETAEIVGSGIGTPTWTPSTTLNNSNTFTPSASPESTTTYFLTVENNGCQRTDEMTVIIKAPINIPNGFTPNDDNNNDIWEIEFINQYTDNQVVIYDRSGQVVFKTVGYNNGLNSWDGTYKGKPVPASTYFYFIDLRNGKENSVFRGPVTVIR